MIVGLIFRTFTSSIILLDPSFLPFWTNYKLNIQFTVATGLYKIKQAQYASPPYVIMDNNINKFFFWVFVFYLNNICLTFSGSVNYGLDICPYNICHNGK